MHKSFGIFWLTICLALVGSLAYGQQYQTYQDPAGKFALQYPTGWQTGSMEVNGQSIQVFLSPADSPQDDFQENVVVMIFPLETGQETLNMVEAYFLEMSRAEIPNMQTVQTQDLTLANLPAKLSLYTGSAQQFDLAFLILYVIHNNEAYVLQATSEANAYQNYQPYFLEILGSFTPTPPQQLQPLLPQQPEPQLPPIPQNQQPPLSPDTLTPTLLPLEVQSPSLPQLPDFE